MFFCLFIALFSTLFWFNIMFAEHITAKVNPYATDNSEEDKLRARIKNILVFIMALFWSVVIIYWQ